MVQNLNYNMEGSFCYDDDIKNCQQYGRLYTWDAAIQACPKGWHLPSGEEWLQLAAAYSEPSNAIPDSKESHQALIAGGKSGFKSLFGGHRRADGSFEHIDQYAFYWSSTEFQGELTKSYIFFLDYVALTFLSTKSEGKACRCIQD